MGVAVFPALVALAGSGLAGGGAAAGGSGSLLAALGIGGGASAAGGAAAGGLLGGGEKPKTATMKPWQAALQIGLSLPSIIMSMQQVARTNRIADQWMAETKPERYHAEGWGEPGFQVLAPPDTGVRDFLRGYSTAGNSQGQYGGALKNTAKQAYSGLLGRK